MTKRLTPEKVLAWWPVVVRYTGLVIAVWVTVFDHFERPSLLVLAAGMMGLEQVVKAQAALARSADDKRGKRRGKAAGEEDE